MAHNNHTNTNIPHNLKHQSYNHLSLPKKTSILPLHEFCTDPWEKRLFQWLCSKCAIGKQLWSRFVEDQRLGLAELLGTFV